MATNDLFEKVQEKIDAWAKKNNFTENDLGFPVMKILRWFKTVRGTDYCFDISYQLDAIKNNSKKQYNEPENKTPGIIVYCLVWVKELGNSITVEYPIYSEEDLKRIEPCLNRWFAHSFYSIFSLEDISYERYDNAGD